MRIGWKKIIITVVILTGTLILFRLSEYIVHYLEEEAFIAEISEEIEKNRSVRTRSLKLTDVAEFHWERVCIFGPYAHRTYINSVIGFDWPKGDETLTWSHEGYALLLFISDQTVNKYFDIPRDPDFADVADRCYSREQANFIIDEVGNMKWIEPTD
jgi:hypothetical protein